MTTSEGCDKAGGHSRVLWASLLPGAQIKFKDREGANRLIHVG